MGVHQWYKHTNDTITKITVYLNQNICTNILNNITTLVLYINGTHWGIKKTVHTEYFTPIKRPMFYVTYFLVHLINYLQHIIYHFTPPRASHNNISINVFLNSNFDRCMKSLKSLVHHMPTSHNLLGCNYNNVTGAFSRLYGLVHSI